MAHLEHGVPYIKIEIMKKIITYEIHGQVERNSYFRVGKALIRIEFKGGSINSAECIPARFITDNPLLQNAIESSEAYRCGQIKKGKVDVIEDESDKVIPQVDSVDNSAFPDVKNMQQARALLMAEPYMCQLSELQTKAAVKAKAAEKGVTFPNWL